MPLTGALLIPSGGQPAVLVLHLPHVGQPLRPQRLPVCHPHTVERAGVSKGETIRAIDDPASPSEKTVYIVTIRRSEQITQPVLVTGQALRPQRLPVCLSLLLLERSPKVVAQLTLHFSQLGQPLRPQCRPVSHPHTYPLDEQLLHRNVKRFRGGLVFKAHRLCVSLNSRLESNKEEEDIHSSPLQSRRICTANSACQLIQNVNFFKILSIPVRQSYDTWANRLPLSLSLSFLLYHAQAFAMRRSNVCAPSNEPAFPHGGLRGFRFPQNPRGT